MKIRTCTYFHGQAFASMRRNSWMTIASIDSGCNHGCFELPLAYQQYHPYEQYRIKVEISVYLQDEITSEEMIVCRIY